MNGKVLLLWLLFLTVIIEARFASRFLEGRLPPRFLKRGLQGSCGEIRQRPSWLFNNLFPKCEVPEVENADVRTTCALNGPPELHITCHKDHYLSDGSVTRTAYCINHTWQGLEHCRPITCAAFTPQRTTTEVPATPYGSDEVLVSCTEGYYTLPHKEHNYTTACQSNGEWSRKENCDKVTCSVPTIENGVFSPAPDPGPEYDYLEEVSVMCDFGYANCQDDRNYPVQCTLTGEWSSAIVCKGIICPEMTLDNTELLDEKLPAIQFPNDIIVHCKPGYKTTRGETSYRANCRGTGIWIHTDSCTVEPNTCPATPIENTKQDNEELPATVHPANIVVSCEKNFYLPDQSSSYTAVCQENGEWDQVFNCTQRCEKRMEFLKSTGKGYLWKSMRVSYDEAIAECINDGGVLAHPITPDVVWVSRRNNMNLRETWVGLRNDSATDNWKWLDGSDANGNTVPWCPGQPDMSIPEPECAVTDMSSTCLSNRMCSDSNKAFLCQYDCVVEP